MIDVCACVIYSLIHFQETHCKHIYDKYSSYDIKEWTAPLVKTFTVDLAEVGIVTIFFLISVYSSGREF